ncbi:hypothetical protein BJ742DRAFT_151171 [Cladochytrium replicatum]|nr:hypothetical protein BJ742DRAFT_151171 [Cladochytrium replicatum]
MVINVIFQAVSDALPDEIPFTITKGRIAKISLVIPWHDLLGKEQIVVEVEGLSLEMKIPKEDDPSLSMYSSFSENQVSDLISSSVLFAGKIVSGQLPAEDKRFDGSESSPAFSFRPSRVREDEEFPAQLPKFPSPPRQATTDIPLSSSPFKPSTLASNMGLFGFESSALVSWLIDTVLSKLRVALSNANITLNFGGAADHEQNLTLEISSVTLAALDPEADELYRRKIVFSPLSVFLSTPSFSGIIVSLGTETAFTIVRRNSAPTPSFDLHASGYLSVTSSMYATAIEEAPRIPRTFLGIASDLHSLHSEIEISLDLGELAVLLSMEQLDSFLALLKAFINGCELAKRRSTQRLTALKEEMERAHLAQREYGKTLERVAVPGAFSFSSGSQPFFDQGYYSRLSLCLMC